MNSHLPKIKIALLVILLIGLGIGFLFFRQWQKNERPTVNDISWDQEQVTLGHKAELTFNITAPWHREVSSAVPTTYPSFLVPIADKGRLKKGQLSITGTRQWKLVVPFVTTDVKPIEGRATSFPLKKTKRVSPMSVNVTLPELKVITPTELPEDPYNPDQFLTDTPPPEPPSEEEEEATSRNPWLWALALLLLIPIAIYFLKRTGILKTTPPWEKALSKLEKLDPNSSPVPFYSKLTDILKQYTSERYEIRARSKTSAEFVEILQKLPHIPDEHLNNLPNFAHLVDEVKFADFKPDQELAPNSLELIRSFIKATTPESSDD